MDTISREPLVSIIVPVYNTAEYLAPLFDSLLGQSYQNLEIICIDDGSSDDSYDILCKYAAENKAVKAFQKSNSGAADTRNYGMRKATGEYLCFVDADDFLEVTAIEKLVEIAVRENTDVVLFDLDNYHQNTNSFVENPSINREVVPVREVFTASSVPNVYKQIIGFTVNKFYRTDFLRKYELIFPKIRAHEDMPFTYLALSLADKIYYLDEVLYHYRRANLASVSNTLERNYIYMFQALEAMREGLIRHNIWQESEKNFNSYVLHMCTWQYSRKGTLSKTEFLETAQSVWFPKFHLLTLTPAQVHDQNDFIVYEKAMNHSAQRALIAKLYRRFSRIPLCVKIYSVLRSLRGKLARFVRSQQAFFQSFLRRNK